MGRNIYNYILQRSLIGDDCTWRSILRCV